MNSSVCSGLLSAHEHINLSKREYIMTIAEIDNVLKLPVEQRILLVEDVWDSIRPQSKRIPVPDSHKQELDRRVEKYRHDPSALLNDQQLRQALGSRG